MKRIISFLFVVCMAAPVLAGDAFDRLKAMEGTWKGMASGAEAEVTYRLTGAGSAVVETLFPGTPHEMVTVYHRDGDDVVLTHYCAGQNQPRMRAKKPGEAAVVSFDYDGGTNIDVAKTNHMHAAKFEWKGADEARVEWTPWSEGKAGPPVVFEIKRVQ